MEVRYPSATIQEAAEDIGRICLKVQWNCHTTIANQTVSILNMGNSPDRYNGGFVPYIKQAAQPTPTDTGTNIPTLVNAAAPSTMFIVGYVRDAVEVIQATVPTVSIINSTAVVTGAAYMTAGAVTLYGTAIVAGNAAGGTTAYNGTTTVATAPATGTNIALLVSCTSLDAHAAIGPVTFWVDIVYRRLKNQV